MPILTRDQILSVSDLVTEIVPVPEWGGEVIVRSLTAAERDEYEKAFITQEGKKIKFELVNPRARLAALAIVDEDGKNVFSAVDVLALGKKNASALDRVYSVAQRLSGISDEDIEELEKNSVKTPDDVSLSD